MLRDRREVTTHNWLLTVHSKTTFFCFICEVIERTDNSGFDSQQIMCTDHLGTMSATQRNYTVLMANITPRWLRRDEWMPTCTCHTDHSGTVLCRHNHKADTLNRNSGQTALCNSDTCCLPKHNPYVRTPNNITHRHKRPPTQPTQLLSTRCTLYNQSLVTSASDLLCVQLNSVLFFSHIRTSLPLINHLTNDARLLADHVSVRRYFRSSTSLVRFWQTHSCIMFSVAVWRLWGMLGLSWS